ncbi:MAG TPA: hypothetical protein VMO00_07950 [Methylomirabilota bacterium]|nr:hypothetical protein [Methylomirabilota bacterium]
MSKSLSFKIILLLALMQGGAGLLRAYNWVQIGVDLLGQGILLLPFLGVLAVMRGLFVSVVAVLYVLFVLGALLGRSWAWWSCLMAVVINLLLFLFALARGAPVTEVIAWSVIPAILILYLFSQMGRDALRGA